MKAMSSPSVLLGKISGIHEPVSRRIFLSRLGESPWLPYRA